MKNLSLWLICGSLIFSSCASHPSPTSIPGSANIETASPVLGIARDMSAQDEERLLEMLKSDNELRTSSLESFDVLTQVPIQNFRVAEVGGNTSYVHFDEQTMSFFTVSTGSDGETRISKINTYVDLDGTTYVTTLLSNGEKEVATYDASGVLIHLSLEDPNGFAVMNRCGSYSNALRRAERSFDRAQERAVIATAAFGVSVLGSVAATVFSWGSASTWSAAAVFGSYYNARNMIQDYDVASDELYRARSEAYSCYHG